MILFRNIHTFLKRWPLLAAVFVLSGNLTASSPLFAEEAAHGIPKTTVQPANSSELPVPDPSSPSGISMSKPAFENDLGYQLSKKLKPGGECMDLSQKVRQPIYHGLQRIYLYVDVTPHFYEYAVQCHGHEGDCVGESAKKFGEQDRHIQELIKTYNSYPAPLHSDRITAVFVEAIKRNLFPWLQPGPPTTCAPPDVQLLDSTTLWHTQYDPGSLLVWVELDLFDKPSPLQVDPTLPRMAILRLSLYRPGLSERERLEEITRFRPMPFALDLPGETLMAIIRRQTDWLLVNYGVSE